jgi:hypothetical protein
MSKLIVDQIQKLTPSGLGSGSPNTLTVTNSGASSYTINAQSNPTLTLVRGSTYTFNVTASGHPFWIQTVAAPYSSGNVYSTGVTNNGAATGTITFVVPSGAPNTLYYVCQNHSVMTGTITVIDVPATATVFTLPATDGTSGQYMKTDGSANLGWSSITNPNPALISALPVPENLGMIGSIVTRSDRQNSYSTGEWTSSGPWTTYSNYSIHTDNSAIQFFNMALGDGMAMSGTSENMIGGDSEHQFARTLQFSNGSRLGYSRDFFHYDNATDYAGHSWRIMPIRNTTGSAITVTLSAYTSNYFSSGYEGTQLAVFAPNTSVYSTCTSVTATSIATSTSNAQHINLTGTYSVPANTTVLVCLTSTDQYQTTYQFKDTNYFYNLGTTFSNSGIICDMRMLYSLHTSRFTGLGYTGAFAAQVSNIWTKTATAYGDR